MGIWHVRSKRKATGGKLKKHRKKRKFEKGREPTLTQIGEKRLAKIRTKGGSFKLALRSASEANVLDAKTKKIKKAKIIKVIENKANPQLVRQNIITKGAIIETSEGKARVTSRPGQHGVINAIKLE